MSEELTADDFPFCSCGGSQIERVIDEHLVSLGAGHVSNDPITDRIWYRCYTCKKELHPNIEDTPCAPTE